MKEVLDFFLELARALFKAFGTAVAEYPFTTVLVFSFIFVFLNITGRFVFFDTKIKKPVPPTTMTDLTWGLGGFIASVVMSNFIGYIFNAVVKFIGWTLGTVGAFTDPFKQYPVAFTTIFIASESIAALILLYKSKWRNRQITFVSAFTFAFAALFATYILTSLYGGIWGTSRASEPEQKHSHMLPYINKANKNS